ncbi:hypothetical protein H5410_053647 [Solanum commersonii]|uniref:F-box associated beta-propeller type 3 domain-containing protein n=1 Tax=Solanum commersonii TaxID=4109 RepID=A0A9J5X6X9_SOLCO|nr:hypothetical protein H5410_053647 [Solanum commersonii]
MWNPSTRESILLPQPRFLLQNSDCMWGLGYDSTSGDYKILFINGEELPGGQILTLKSGSWRNIDKHTLVGLRVGWVERNMLVGVSVLDGMLCAYATYGHASNRAFEIWLASVEAIPKRFAEGEVLFWVKLIFHKMRHSVRTIYKRAIGYT